MSHSHPVHLVLLNQYYPPDAAPTGLMLEAVAEALANAGHCVTILAAAGGYATGKSVSGATSEDSGERNSGGAAPGPAEEQETRGIRVIRIGATRFGRGSFIGKLADYLSFYGGVKWKLAMLQPRPDRVVALTTPPYLSVVARLFSKARGADHAHWVMDLYPDVMQAHGMLARHSLLFRLLGAVARFGFGGSRCAAVVTLGPDMAGRVSAHLPQGRKAEWVALWETEAAADSGGDPVSALNGGVETGADAGRRLLRTARGWGDDECVFMYSGNMGLGHRLGEFLAASMTPADPAVASRWVFFGGGKRRGEVEAFLREHPQAPVELHDYVPRKQLADHLLSADVHLASLEPSWDGTMLPSKLQGIFAVGRPVIFVGSRTSAMGQWIEESGGGWVVAPDNPDALGKAASEAMDPSVRREKGTRGNAFHHRHFNKARNAARVAALLAKPGPDS